jgi:GNAT superfamily N-acetyltransferase
VPNLTAAEGGLLREPLQPAKCRSNMQYRHATISDSPVLSRMNHRLIRDEGHHNPMSVDELQARMEGWLAGEYQAVLFEDADSPAGYALFRRDGDTTILRQFFIQPERRRQGVGRQAMAWMLESLWADAVRIRLEVLAGNSTAIQFWRSLGFVDYCITMDRRP